MTFFRSACFLILLGILSTANYAQADACLPPGPTPAFDFNTWINCRVRDLVVAKINQRGTNKQVQLPSLSEATTSLVDQTEAPDLVGLALNLSGVNSEADNKDATSFTTSAYAVFAAASQHDPLDPVFYKKYADLRRFSFSFGREAADETAAAGLKQKSIVIGTKILLVNRRDVSKRRNRVLLDPLSVQLGSSAPDFLATADEVQNYLYSQFAAGLGLPSNPAAADLITFNGVISNTAQFYGLIHSLSDDQKTAITRILEKRIDSQIVLSESTQRVIDNIRRAPQFAFTFQSKLRGNTGTDEYRTGIAFDYGISNRMNLALNGTFDYTDSKIIGGDSRGGRFAVESYFHLTPEKKLFSGKDPIVLGLAGEGKWMTSKLPTYTGQFKITFPLFDGISLPLSISYANRKDLLTESRVKGNFGFSFDLAKLLKGVKP